MVGYLTAILVALFRALAQHFFPLSTVFVFLVGYRYLQRTKGIDLGCNEDCDRILISFGIPRKPNCVCFTGYALPGYGSFIGLPVYLMLSVWSFGISLFLRTNFHYFVDFCFEKFSLWEVYLTIENLALVVMVLTITIGIGADVIDHIEYWYHQSKGGYCWVKACSLADSLKRGKDYVVLNLGQDYYETQTRLLELNGTLTREEFLLLVKHHPSRDWLAGRIHVDKHGRCQRFDKFNRRSHRRIYYGQSSIHRDAKYVHVNVENVINVATAANASTMGQNEANQRFKNKTTSTFRVNLNMTPKQEKELRELASEIPFDIVGGKNNSSDHPVLAGARQLLRQMFESLYRIRASNLPTLVVGSAYGDLDDYSVNTNVDHYFAGVESKDYLRTIVPLLERFSSKLRKNMNGAGSKVALRTYTAVISTLNQLLGHVKTQEGWKMGLFTKIDELKHKYERLVFRDIYEVDPQQMEDLFIRTGANHAVGYGIYPDELVFDDVAPDKHYRFDYNPVSDRATMTYRGGYANGYSHKKSTWGWFLRSPVLTCPQFTLVTEIVARVGPYAIYSITKHTGGQDYVPRTIGLPRNKHRAMIMDVAKVYKGGNPNDSRFAVNLDEWVAVRNWAASLQAKALTHDVIVMYIRRMIGGVSLVNKELVSPWTLKPADASKLALAVLIDVHREKNLVDEVFDYAFGFAPMNLAKQAFKKPVGLLDGLAKFVRNNGISSEIAIYPDNEFFVLDSTPLLRNDDSLTSYHTNVDCTAEVKIGCTFCSEIAPRIGKQVVHCHNSAAPGAVDCSMNDEELREIRNSLQDDDNLPTGLAKLFASVKGYVPTAGFENSTKFSYILGGPGGGKSHLIRAIAEDEDAIYVPFMKLKVDYENVPDPKDPKRRRDLKFATTHRGLKSLGLCKRLFVDEFTALDWRYLKLVIRLTAPDEVFIIGDTHQTGIRTGTVEGVNISDRVDIDALPRHELKINFRNGPDTVHWMNRMCDYGFGSLKSCDLSDPNSGQKPSLFSFVKGEAWDRYRTENELVCDELFFTHRVAAANGKSQNDIDKYTVRSYQGSTVDRAIVYLTEDDLAVAEAHGMLLVALTRARYGTYIVHDGSRAVQDFLIRNNLPITGPYWQSTQPVDLPKPENSFTREITAPLGPAMDFARHVRRRESVEEPVVVKTWFSLSSYQVLCCLALLVRVSGFNITSVLLLMLGITGFELEFRRSNIFKATMALVMVNWVGWLHQGITLALFVIAPDSYLYSLFVNHGGPLRDTELSLVRSIFGPLVARFYGLSSVYWDKIIEFLRESVLGLSIFSRFMVSLPLLQRWTADIKVLEDFPSRLGIISTWFYFLLFAGYLLYLRRGARIVFRVAENSQVSTASVCGSFFSTTLQVTFGSTVKAHALDYFKHVHDAAAKPMGAAYTLLASTWMPQSIHGIKFQPELDLEAQVPGVALRVTPCDAYRAADTVLTGTVFEDADQTLTNGEQVMIQPAIRNGTIDRDDSIVPLDKKRRPATTSLFHRASSGWGYHFARSSVWQSIKAVSERYLASKVASKRPGPSQIAVAQDIVRMAMKEMFVQGIEHREDLMEIAIEEAQHKAQVSNYSTQVSEDSFDAHKVRMFMKETFKPGPLSNLKPFNPFKSGMGVSPFDKSAHVVFATIMRYFNMLVLAHLQPHVIYDNRMTEEQLQEAVNSQLSKVPNVAVNGVTDFKMYDAQQDEFCQLLLKELALAFGFSVEMLDHYFSFCSGSQVLSDGGLKGKLGFEKLSGDPATLLFNSMLGGMITNYLFRGEGPFVMLIKGDDGFKRQLGLRADQVHSLNLANSTRLQAVQCIEEPAEFCGKIVGTVMCDSVYRKLTSLLSKNWRNYGHYMEAMESVRNWLKKVEDVPVSDFEEFVAQNAELLSGDIYGAALTDTESLRVQSVFSALETIRSYTHLSEEQFVEAFPLRDNPRVVPASGQDAKGVLTAVPTL